MLYDIIVFSNKMNWAKHVRNLSNDTGFSHVWNNRGVANEVCFLSMLRQRLPYIIGLYIYMFTVGDQG